MRKCSIFVKNHWQTPLQNFDFLDFFKTSLFLTKNHSFLSKILNNNLFWLNLPKKYPWENIWLFEKNHRLTTLGNFDFFGLFQNFTFLVWKEFAFYPKHQTTTFSGLICQKHTHEKIFDWLRRTNFSQIPIFEVF